MEDDYLPLYEVVDYDKDNDHSSNAAKSRGYEKLIGKDSVVDGVQEEYQLPQSEARYVPYETYSEVATEIQTLKRNSRHVKTVFSIGGIIMFILVIIIVCISAVMWIRFGKNLVNVQKSLIEDVNNVQEHSNAKQPEHDWSFQNCSQETTVCNFTKNPSGSGSWLYCDTPRLKTDKRVR